MNTSTATATPRRIINGVDVDQVGAVISEIEQDADFARCQFRARNRWIEGDLNRSRIQGFYAGGEEDDTREQPYQLDNCEPPLLAGIDTAPNPVEYVLHALAGCLTTTMVYHAAVRGIEVASCESFLEGDLDLRGLLGMSDEVRKGYSAVRVTLKVRSEASAQTLKELARFSAVYDIVSNSLPVDLRIEKA